MSASRLTLALDGGDVSLPEAGRIAVFGPRIGTDLSSLPKERVRVLTGNKPDYDYFAGLGYDCDVLPNGRFSASVICLPRAKPLARALVAEAVAVTDGTVIVDGLKTDGVESILKDLRKRVEVSPPLSKAHGKLFMFQAQTVFDDWVATSTQIEGGFITLPGVFSADGIDEGSRLLAEHLPDKLGKQVADLGGGWGYLSARILERGGVEAVHLVEADHAALECARQNVSDARVQLHWADATVWQPEEKLDAVVMNPPFHTGRAADPALGRAFIAAAAAMLKPSGQLWLVANRHLPYERTLEPLFKVTDEVAGDRRFKILQAQRPSRQKR